MPTSMLCMLCDSDLFPTDPNHPDSDSWTALLKAIGESVHEQLTGFVSEHILVTGGFGESPRLQKYFGAWFSNTSRKLTVLNDHSVEVIIYQFSKLFGYGSWMTSIPTIAHSFIFLGYSEFSSWLPWQLIQYYSTPKVTN